MQATTLVLTLYLRFWQHEGNQKCSYSPLDGMLVHCRVTPSKKSLNLLKFNDIIHSEIFSFVYQWFHKLVPSCFLDFFTPISSIHEYPTRQSLNENLFINPIRTTQYGIRSLHYTGSNLWNSLPITTKQITPFSRFRKTLKKQIIDSYNNITSS